MNTAVREMEKERIKREGLRVKDEGSFCGM